jgi:ABC-type proline/glycine betaine transport system substrate-binding protein
MDGIYRKQRRTIATIVRSHLHDTNPALFQIINNFEKSFKSKTKKIRDIRTECNGKNMEKRMHGQFPHSLDKKLVDEEQPY